MNNEDRVLILDLLDILRRNSDENHRLTQNDIIELLEQAHGVSYKSKRKTIKNNIEKLIKHFEANPLQVEK